MHQSTDGRWHFLIDRGGTFTDVVARRPDGTLRVCKVLSEDPSRAQDAVIAGIREAMGLTGTSPLPLGAIASVRMATTVATNALLERKGEPTALLITRGFRDALRIGYQNRPRLFARHIRLPAMLYTRVVEVDERLDAEGRVVRPLDARAVRDALTQLRESGVRAIAIVFMHAWREPRHEREVETMARALGFAQISISSEVSPLIKLVGRGDTTVVDAYLSPLLGRYVTQLAAQLPGIPLQFMQSSGGLAQALHFRGKDALLSGPAGGIVGAANVSARGGYPAIISFDMGGTSTDVAHYAGEFERSFDTTVAGIRVRTPMMTIHTVAAGGGSLLRFEGGRLRVGPQSAGADPGPACYRRGGPLTITDANLQLGRIVPEWFPKVFGPTGDQPLDAEAARSAFARLREEISADSTRLFDSDELAAGFVEIAVANMANAIKRISIERGHDVTRHALCAFGGAGGQHACAVADALGMTSVIIHPLAGVLSAYGLGHAKPTVLRERSVEQPLAIDPGSQLESALSALETDAREVLAMQVGTDRALHPTWHVHLRFEGTDTALRIAWDPPATLAARFTLAWQELYGFILQGRPVIAATIAVEVSAGSMWNHEEGRDTGQHERGPPERQVSLYAGGQRILAPLFLREKLAPAQTVLGPALIVEAHGSIVIDPGWSATSDTAGVLVLARSTPMARQVATGTDVDPIRLEIFNNHFMAIAEEMGERLRQTAHSVNIKERLDFSCAIFDGAGELVANAPHIPVHLGSMSESVRAVMEANAGEIRAGDAYVLNSPYHGGTHLPDITVVTPVFDASGRELLFWTGSRGHHADVGGSSPGSMPPDSRTVEEEGVLIDNFLLVRDGVFREDSIRELLGNGPYPARNSQQNIADLRAQVAANERGSQALRMLVDTAGLDVVQAYMGHVQDNAEECVRRVIEKLHPGSARHRLDNGAEIAVRVTVDRRRRVACIDFAGTSAEVADNFNAPGAVTKAAVLYVFRTLVEENIPLNAGCLRPLEILIPKGCMLSPRSPAAVVAGNVETSQGIVDALFAALGVMANAQGTMNNLTFGNADHQYYETIAGGSGAGPGFDGADVVQTHMTNSRLTDPEVLESRFPVRVERFSVRTGSGGAGRYRGGNGAIRCLRFLEGMTASILSSRRLHAPAGLAGGGDGARGINRVRRANGALELLGPQARVEMNPGDCLEIETPGGGGYGAGENDQMRHGDLDA